MNYELLNFIAASHHTVTLSTATPWAVPTCGMTGAADTPVIQSERVREESKNPLRVERALNSSSSL